MISLQEMKKLKEDSIWIKSFVSFVLFVALFILFEYFTYTKFDKTHEFTFKTLVKDGGIAIPTYFAIKLHEIFKFNKEKKEMEEKELEENKESKE